MATSFNTQQAFVSLQEDSLLSPVIVMLLNTPEHANATGIARRSTIDSLMPSFN